MEAKRLLTHPLICEFFEKGQENLFHRFRNPYNENGQIATVKDRERIFLMLQALQEFNQFFQKLIIDGTMVEREIAEKESAAD